MKSQSLRVISQTTCGFRTRLMKVAPSVNPLLSLPMVILTVRRGPLTSWMENSCVDLLRWSAIQTVQTCAKGRAKTGKIPKIRAFTSDVDPLDTGNHGHECEYDESLDRLEENYECVSFKCVGSNRTMFHGQYVTAQAIADVEITEIVADGWPSSCKFSAITDDDGAYELPMSDLSGKLPLKAHVSVGAYKEEVFPKTKVQLLDSRNSSQAGSAPAYVLLVLTERARASSLGVSPPRDGAVPVPGAIESPLTVELREDEESQADTADIDDSHSPYGFSPADPVHHGRHLPRCKLQGLLSLAVQVFKTSRVLWFLEQLEMFKEVRRWNLHKNVEVNVLSSVVL